jgi:hypothetical protein
MDAIRSKYSRDATAARVAIVAKFSELDGFMQALNADPSVLSARVIIILFFLLVVPTLTHFRCCAVHRDPIGDNAGARQRCCRGCD